MCAACENGQDCDHPSQRCSPCRVALAASPLLETAHAQRNELTEVPVRERRKHMHYADHQASGF